jgi:hypothetical protein
MSDNVASLDSFFNGQWQKNKGEEPPVVVTQG